MRGLGETLVFGGAALALHLALWPAERPAGAEAAGGGGDDLVTMSAASAAIARAVADWDRPPAPAVDAQAALAPPQIEDAGLPAPVPDRQAALPRPPAPVAAPALPTVARPPDPPPRPTAARVEPATPDTPRPAPRPERPAKPPLARADHRQADQAPAPSQTSAAQVSRRAAGEGGNARGQRAKAESATVSPAQARSLMAEWGGRIRARIARGVPRGAGAGTAVVRLTVAADGTLLAARLARSSGNPRIDDLALAAVRGAGRFPAAPAQLGARPQSFDLPVQSR